jgi:hypothetical protein
MDAWDRLDALEDGLWHIREAMDALKRADPDAVAALADICGPVAVATQRARQIVEHLEAEEDDALRREYEEGLL